MVTQLLPVRVNRTVASQTIADADSNAAISRGERGLIAAFFTMTLFWRVVYVFRYRFNSDEPQHLHVAWGWTRGLLQYRDVFDNHTPLFHLLFAPLVGVLGERPDVLLWMRLAMIPLAVLSLWATYRIGLKLFSRRTGLWAAVFTGLLPGFFIYTVQFRTDVLWATLWLLALDVLLQGPPTSSRSFFGGLLLGAALSVSMKTILLLAALGVALLSTRALAPNVRRDTRDPGPGRLAAAALAGFVLVPLGLALFFAVQDAGAAFFYGAVVHNLVSGLGSRPANSGRVLLLVFMLPPLGWAARTIAHRAPDPAIGARRAVVFLAAGLYFLAVHTFWPVFSAQDHLPFYPLLVVLLTPSFLAVAGVRKAQEGRTGPARPWLDAAAPAAVAVAELVFLLAAVPVWRDGTRDEVGLLTDVLRLTRAEDPVLDLKGETVFRSRPFYYALESVTQARLRQGLIVDDIPERLIATRTCVTIADVGLFPVRGRAFLEENYLPVGRLRVAGRLLASHIDGTGPIAFEIEIPARYSMISDAGAAAGGLDGRPYEGARFLDRGHHEFRPSAGTGRLAVVWAQAVERGYLPFPVQKRSL